MVDFDRFVFQPLFGTKLSPSPSSEGELATLTQACLRGGRTNTIKREGANAKVERGEFTP